MKNAAMFGGTVRRFAVGGVSDGFVGGVMHFGIGGKAWEGGKWSGPFTLE